MSVNRWHKSFHRSCSSIVHGISKLLDGTALEQQQQQQQQQQQNDVEQWQFLFCELNIERGGCVA